MASMDKDSRIQQALLVLGVPLSDWKAAQAHATKHEDGTRKTPSISRFSQIDIAKAAKEFDVARDRAHSMSRGTIGRIFADADTAQALSRLYQAKAFAEMSDKRQAYYMELSKKAIKRAVDIRKRVLRPGNFRATHSDSFRFRPL